MIAARKTWRCPGCGGLNFAVRRPDARKDRPCVKCDVMAELRDGRIPPAPVLAPKQPRNEPPPKVPKAVKFKRRDILYAAMPIGEWITTQSVRPLVPPREWRSIGDSLFKLWREGRIVRELVGQDLEHGIKWKYMRPE